MLCQKCNKREGTEIWSESLMAWNHGHYWKWCRICCVEAQLEDARKQAERIPELVKVLNELLKEEFK